MLISQDLYEALRDWLHWAETGELAKGRFFTKQWGLCTNMADNDCYEEFNALLVKEFGINWVDPFCSEDQYFTLSATRTQHKHKPRLDWVKEKLNAYETAKRSVD